MGGRVLTGVVAASVVVLAGPVLAGGAGFHGSVRRPMMHPAMGGWHGGWSGWHGAARPMPPVAGVIHERPGGRPYYAAYGHANTGYLPAGGARWGYGNRRFWSEGSVATGDRGAYDGFGRARFRRSAGDRWERERFAAGRGPAVYRYGRGYARYAGYGGGGVYLGGDDGLYGGGVDAGSGYGTPGTYGASGTYGTPGTYGHYGTDGGSAYLSEPPLAATRTEAPLAPSPYGPDGGYYAPRRTGIAPHVLFVDRSQGGCGCAPAAPAYPTIYRYGVGTAY